MSLPSPTSAEKALFPDEPEYKSDASVAGPEVIENAAQVQKHVADAIAASSAPLTEEQQQKLAALKAMMSPEEQAYRFCTDITILRFLRARKWDVHAAHKMLSASIAWRKEEHMDDFIPFPPLHAIGALRRVLNKAFHGVDRAGRPLIFSDYGSIDPAQMALRVNDFDFVQAHLWLLEKWCQMGDIQSQHLGRAIQLSTVVDLRGVGLSHRHFLRFLKLAAVLLEKNYPETLGLTLIVNAPPMFAYFWGIVRPWLDEHTASKIQILGPDYQRTLQEYVDPKYIPKDYGGQCECADGCIPKFNQTADQYDQDVRESAPKLFKLQTVNVRPGRIHTMDFRVEPEDIAAAVEANGRVQLEYYFTSDKDIRFHVDFLPFDQDPLEPLLQAEMKASGLSPRPVDLPSPTNGSNEKLQESGRQTDTEATSTLRLKRSATLQKLTDHMDRATRDARTVKMKKYQPLTTFQSQLVPILGSVFTYVPGTFFFHFDNYNSYLSSKNVTFGVRLTPVLKEDLNSPTMQAHHADWPMGANLQ